MWIFYSGGVIMPSERPADTFDAEQDDRVIQIRARAKSHLERLKEGGFFPQMGEIIFFPHTDYEYRVHCTRAQLAEVMTRLALDIDYTKFKPTTEDRWKDVKLHNLYNAVWGLFYDRYSTNRYLDQKVKPKKSKKGGGPVSGRFPWEG